LAQVLRCWRVGWIGIDIGDETAVGRGTILARSTGEELWAKRAYGLSAFILAAFFAVLSLDPAGIGTLVRGNTQDVWQLLAPRGSEAAKAARTEPARPVVLVEIDAATERAYGEWPWNRVRLASLSRAIAAGEPSALVLDLPLYGLDPSAPETLANDWQRLGSAAAAETALSLPDPDRAFAGALRQAPALVYSAEGLAPVIPKASLKRRVDDVEVAVPDQFLSEVAGAEGKPVAELMPRLSEGLAAAAPDGLRPDADGVVRHIHILSRAGSAEAPEGLRPTGPLFAAGLSLGSEPAPIFRGNTTDWGLIETIGLAGVRLGAFELRTQAAGDLRLYAQDTASITRLSASAVLDGTRVPKDALVLLALGEQRAGTLTTPLRQAATPGAVSAMALEQMLSGVSIVRPVWTDLAELLALVLAGIAFVTLLSSGRFFVALGLFVAMSAAALAAAYYAFTEHLLLTDPIAPILGVALVFLVAAVTRLSENAKRRRAMTAALEAKLPSGAVNRVMKAYRRRAFGAEVRKTTVMFCDIRGYPQVSQALRDDPEGLAYLLNTVHGYITRHIIASGGVADTNLGTTIMGFWNAPNTDEMHAVTACETALRLVNSLEDLNRALEMEADAAGRPFAPISLAVGINTGPAVVGNLGTEYRVDYTAIGDPVHIARRLQTYSEHYGPAVIVGEHTYNEVKNRFALLPIDRLGIDGRRYTVNCYALVGNPVRKASPGFRALEQAHEEVFKAYTARNWAMARALLRECRKMPGATEQLYDLFEQRIAFFETNPPPEDWDGAFRTPIV